MAGRSTKAPPFPTRRPEVGICIVRRCKAERVGNTPFCEARRGEFIPAKPTRRTKGADHGR